MWLDVSLRAGASVIDIHDFLEDIINDIGHGGVVGGVDNTHAFFCDNLTSHMNALIWLLIECNSHRLVFRAPHYSVDGPIECFLNHPQQQLTMELHKVRTADDLQQAIFQICQRAQGQFDRHFAHCGSIDANVT